jgi:acetyl esterase/lipase
MGKFSDLFPDGLLNGIDMAKKQFLLAAVLLSFRVCAGEFKDLHYHSAAELAAGDDYMRSQCRLDLKCPDGTTGWPVVLWFHGGGLEGGARHYPKLPEEIAVIAVGYRLHPHVGVPVFIEDAAAAAAWAIRSIAHYGGDTNSIFVAGHSAGGYLAAMVGLDPRWLAVRGVDHRGIAGIIPVSGQVSTHFNVKKWLGDTGPQYRPLVDAYAPLYHVKGELPPICLITGGRAIEWKGRVEENELLAACMRHSGNRLVEFHEMGGLDHGTVGQGAMHIIPGFIKRMLAARAMPHREDRK